MPKTAPFKKLLVANRGEIAIRICRAASELQIKTVGIYSYEDRFALHRFKSDQSFMVGHEGEPLKAYLDIEGIIAIAKKHGVDAIHPGYGFLSENAEFAERCAEEGITFIGPSPRVLKMFGDKVAARQAALEAGLTVIPGTSDPIPSVEEAKKIASEIGYPIALKAVAGGGGKGIRMIHDESELIEGYERARSEAMTSFGMAEVYLEKRIVSPKHIEVQIVGDKVGNIVHLFERDCSIQRRHQKVVEVAPAFGISEESKNDVYDQSLMLAKNISYSGLGTVEFLVGDDGKAYFLEVNPRVQVEHTVTEMVTGFDLIQTSILVSAGYELNDPSIGITSQDDIKICGAAIQCRITTEDPLNNFAPDTGRLIAYRPATGFGIRLDEGHGTSGGVITPYFDSLLVKVTAYARNFEAAAKKMGRSLAEFRIRGVKHNIPLLKNVVRHEAFLRSEMDTDFLENHPELFNYTPTRDRATKILRYLADVTINNPHGLEKEKRGPKIEAPTLEVRQGELSEFSASHFEDKPTAKQVFQEGGVEALKKWIKDQKQLLLTDTTMRDAHQSLFATRLRTKDMMEAAPFYKEYGHRFFSLEMWGGATFDASLRFLKEDPWRRLEKMREEVPDALLQMLLRGDNAVGYANYPKWVVKEFIAETVKSGLDVFRIFDCLNQADKMVVAVEEVKKQGAIAEVSVCYTGNILSPDEKKFTVDYYKEKIKEFDSMGADIICIKDMAGLLRPSAAKVLIESIKEVTDLPIHLHTHDTSGTGVTMLLEAAKAGCDIVDGAVSSMSGMTSQPSLNSLVASLEENERRPEVPLPVLDSMARYWETVRCHYQAFDPGIRSTSTEVYNHEIPGGQFSNLFEQARRVGLSSKKFHETTKRYQEVNKLFGNIVKVTPSSKVVGDMALLLQKHELTGEEYLETKPKLDYPDSVLSFFKGHMGVPHGGFPKDVRNLVLGENCPHPTPPEVDSHDSLDEATVALSKKLGREVTKQEVLSHRIYPKVFDDYHEFLGRFGKTDKLSTDQFFYGLEEGVETVTDIEEGKTLIITLKGMSEPDVKGVRRVFFNLNGFPREIEILDASTTSEIKAAPKAQSGNLQHIGAAMPSKILDIQVAVGDEVIEGQVVCVTEAMKMEYAITTKVSGMVKNIHVSKGNMVEGGDLLIEIG